MKKTISAALILLACGTAGAQVLQGIIDRHPANASGTKEFTTESITLDRSIYPTQASLGWDSEGFITGYIGNKMYRFDVKGNELPVARDAQASARPRHTGLPENAADVTSSPDRSMAAYTVGKSLYYIDSFDKSHLIAESEGERITYGQSVSRNEFGIGEGIYWSPMGRKIAFYRKDEAKVTDFPLLDIDTRTGELVNIPYPMNGMDSELITLGIYDLSSGKTVWVKADDFTEERFLTNISWSPDEKYVFIQVLDRTQHHMRLNMYRADNGVFVRTLLTEDNDAWVEPYSQLHFLKGTYQFIYSSDNRDGYKSLYLCDTLGTVRRIVNVNADIEYLDNNGSSVFYRSSEVSPAERHVCRVEIRQGMKKNVAQARFGKPVRLTGARGVHRVSFSPDYKYIIDSYSSFNNPSATEIRQVSDGSLTRVLFQAADPLSEYRHGEVIFGSLKSADGLYDNHYRMILPFGFDPGKKYPVMVYVYGGPHTQLVNDSWLGQIRMLEMLMAQKGYIVYVQDNRGTPYHGTAYEKAINRQLGVAEMQDQMVGINMLRSLPYVDKDRMGVHGWSYGGFMTISLMTTYPDVFKVGVAGGPVIDWKWYEIMYGERYMDTEATNPEGFAKVSLINKAKNLKGKLLICQGAIDDTVVWEHSLSFVQKCIEENIQLDYFPYPRTKHNVAGDWRVHLNQKIADYFTDHL
ncbi:MAG: S9 family peptidase [Bacteroidales bacterium]|nr:S9 family peptidase [Bacteroidales bacterium]